MKATRPARLLSAVPALALAVRLPEACPFPSGLPPTFSLVRRGRQPAYAVFAGEGPHTLEINTLDGECVLRAIGAGPRAYSLADLASKTVYAISGRTLSGDFSRRLLTP